MTDASAPFNAPLASGRFCDFCSDPHPPWDYPCESFELWGLVNSLDSWGACDACHLLIQADQWDALAERSKAKMGVPAIPLHIHRQIHEAFRKHRKGPALRSGTA